MNTNTNGRRTSMSIRRAVPAVAIVALAIGLGACQTPPRGAAVPQAPVIQPAEVPAGVDTSRPADRITEQLERQAKLPSTHFPSWTADRLEAQLEYEASLTVKSTDRFRGMSADRIEEKLAREQAANDARYEGVPADRIDERLQRQVGGMRIQ